MNQRRKDKTAGLQQGEWRTGEGREHETASPSDAGKVTNSDAHRKQKDSGTPKRSNVISAGPIPPIPPPRASANPPPASAAIGPKKTPRDSVEPANVRIDVAELGRLAVSMS
jgi:hypothetical protein